MWTHRILNVCGQCIHFKCGTFVLFMALSGRWSWMAHPILYSYHYLYFRPPVHLMMTSSNGNFSALLALCAGNSPVTGEFPSQNPVTRSFDVFFDLRLNKRLSKQSWGWWFVTLSRSLWRHRNVKFDNRVYNDESLANTFVHYFLLSSFQQGAPRERNVRSNLFLPTVAQDKMPYCQM